MSDIIKGESVIAREDYDLFGTNVNGMTGFFIRKDKVTEAHLVYFPELEEWGEIKEIERLNPGEPSEEGQKFAARVQEMNYREERSFYGFNNKEF